MSWTVAGGHNMAKVIQLRNNGQLEEWAYARTGRGSEREDLEGAAGRLRAEMKRDPQAWLDAHLPAIDGPPSDRPWVRVLRGINRLSEAGHLLSLDTNRAALVP